MTKILEIVGNSPGAGKFSDKPNLGCSGDLRRNLHGPLINSLLNTVRTARTKERPLSWCKGYIRNGARGKGYIRGDE
jgi:hypothetical protein